MKTVTAPTDRIVIGSQDATLTRHLRPRAAGAAYRVVARINAYQAQSSIVLARWDGASWQPVTELTGTELTTWEAAKSARIRKTFTADVVEADVATLMAEAAFITADFQ